MIQAPFLQNIHHFSKKCSPPSVGSLILKAAQQIDHEKFASWALQLGQYPPFLHHLLHLEICKIHWGNVYFLFMPPFGMLCLASSALSHAFKVTLPHFRIALSLILRKSSPSPALGGKHDFDSCKGASSCNTFLRSPTLKQISTISVQLVAMHAVMISSSCSRRLRMACFLSPIGNSMPSIN